MTSEVNIFLLLFGSIQGFLLGAWMIREHKSKLSNSYFIIFLVVIGLQLTFKVIAKSWLMDHVYNLYVVSYKLPFLVGPLLYLYIVSRNKGSFSFTHFWHFLPFGASLILLFGHYHVHPGISAFVQIISLIGYGFVAYRIAERKLKSFVLLTTIIECVIATALAMMVLYFGRFPDIRLIFISLTLLIYWISYKVVSDKDSFIETRDKKKKKYAHSRLRPEESKRIQKMLSKLLIDEEVFKDSSLTMQTLATKIDSSPHHLSQVLNDQLGKTYTQYLNEIRLEHVRKKLISDASLRFTIAALAHDSGFNSVSTFNELFRKQYGMTPSQYRKSHFQPINS